MAGAPRACSIVDAERARAASTAIARLMQDAPDEAAITLKAQVLRSVCAMLDALSAEVSRCCGSDCMARPIDGVRLWASQTQLDAAQARAAALEQEVAQLRGETESLRATLARIAECDLEAEVPADETEEGGDWLVGLLGDPGAQATRLRTLAADALEGPPRARH